MSTSLSSERKTKISSVRNSPGASHVTVILSVKSAQDLCVSSQRASNANDSTKTNRRLTVVDENESKTNKSKGSDKTIIEFGELNSTKTLKRKNVVRKKLSQSRPKRARDYCHKCEICAASFYRNDHLTSHMASHSASRSWKCDTCKRHFKTHRILVRHVGHVHADSIKLHPCDQCDFKARSKGNLNKHKILKHTQAYNFSCDTCGKRFKLKCVLRTHMRCHESGPCICDVCGKLCANVIALNQHRNAKHVPKVREHECPVCRRRFMSQKNLDAHRPLHEVKYVCDACGRECKSGFDLRRHQRTHTGEKPHLCPVCGKSFTLLGSQQVHLLTHAGERPYVCDVCGKSFTQRSPMMLHRRRQHPDVTDPPPPPVKIGDLLHGVRRKIKDAAQSKE